MEGVGKGVGDGNERCRLGQVRWKRRRGVGHWAVRVRKGEVR